MLRAALVAAAVAVAAAPPPARLKNVLLIVIDDLRPQLGAYGLEEMHTPNIDKIASEGVLFTRAYAQQAICGPTRNSFMSGRYPEKTLTWNFIEWVCPCFFPGRPADRVRIARSHFREAGAGPDWTAMPEFFRDRGYFATGAGKVYHPDKPPHDDQQRSWSEPWTGSHGPMAQCPCTGEPESGVKQATCEGLETLPACGDDAIADTIIDRLHRAANGTLGNGSQPFFIAAGLHKPHLPFHAEPQDFARYPDPSPPVPARVPEGMPYVAWHSCLSHSPGVNFSDWGNWDDIASNRMTIDNPMPAALATRLRRGYFASVTYTDRNVGRILAAAEPMLPDTVVALIGDHGWSLGEQNEW